MLLAQPGTIGPLRLRNRVVMAPMGTNCSTTDGLSTERDKLYYADPHWCLKAFGEVKAAIRKCVACNVCYERLTLEKDVACVHNPMIGTEFEALEHAEPQLFPHLRTRRPRRVLVLGAGVSGVEAARALAGRGHHVEIWEKSPRVGGQIHNRPGNFLTCLRDAWMVAFSVDHRFREARPPARALVSKGSD